MTTKEATHLQRIGEGLPILARIENGILYLSPPNRTERSWAEFPIDGGGERERYDGTLEAFRKGERLDSETILERGIASLLEESETSIRLVLNHREDGDPIVKPEWKAKGIVVVPRPTLARSEGESSWTLARSLPCSEIREYRQVPDGSWTVEKELRIPVEGEPRKDRYATTYRSIPVRPLAKPFAIRPVGRSEKDASLNSYRM
jgi:hypothetical protein